MAAIEVLTDPVLTVEQATALRLKGLSAGSIGPLAALDEDPNKLEKLEYPLKLGAPNYPHYVAFTIKDIIPQKLDKLLTEVKTALSSANSASTLLQENPNLEINATEEKSFSSLKSFLKSASEAMDIQSNRTQVKAIINLYMPDSLKDNYNPDYGSISIRDELGPILGGIRSAASIAGNAASSPGTVLDSISNDPAAIKFSVDKIVGLLGGGGGLGEALLQTQGYTSNPQLQMIYRGSQFRTFSLDFLFTPVSGPEAEVVRKIIYLFKFFAAPTVGVGVATAKESMFLTPPALFQVKFMKNGVENINLPKYTDCVLDDISVDYAPNGFAAHTDGAPIQTHLTLTFQEVEILDRKRLRDGFQGGEAGLR
jgi:hypothetical protein